MRPAGLDQRHGAVEQRRLLLDPLGKRARADAPFGVGIAPPGAGAGAGRVDQHEIGAAREIGEHVGLAARRADLDVARAGARDPFVDRHQLALVDVGRVDLAAIFHRCGERQRLAAGAGGEIDHLLARFGAGEQRGKLRAFVLDFDRALAKHRLGMDRRAFGIGAKPDAQAERRPSRRFGAKMLELWQHLLALGDERVDAHIERRAARQRRALGGPLVAEHPREMRIEPIRIVALNAAPAHPRARRHDSAACSASVNGAGAKRAPLHNASIAATSRPRSRCSMPISAARGLASPISQADDALRRSAS